MNEAVVEEREVGSADAGKDRPNGDHFNAWRTVLFNCDCHHFNEVIQALLKAIHCSVEEAQRLAWEAHKNGRSVVYRGYFEKAELVCSVIQSSGLLAKVSQ
jgi:ATP-dependent Clp protease adapter protein ClpS